MDNKEKFKKYEKILREWSTKMNLVAPSTLDDIENRHFKDSAQLADFLPKDVNIIDLGSGAGFPGVVLAILGWNVTCIESISKKAGFLSVLKQELDLPNLTVINDRIEHYLKKLPAFSKKNVFTARAFAPLIKIFDYTYKQNSRLFLLKGREIEKEIAVAKTKYKFDYELYPSKTGDGFITIIRNLK
ncbi:MAG: 16S rRNA (guanine(527)-N(7))-methyltransferase RsmG [Alphaproteobacteria bacterium]|nr:16S rRNA (guanine(527)-N(7))-methyltransferase RsmG [Alphaproteobacteria bacterium]